MKGSKAIHGAIGSAALLGVFALAWAPLHGIGQRPAQTAPKPTAKVEAKEKSEYLDSLEYFQNERAYPGTQVDWRMYRDLAEQRNFSGQILGHVGNTWKFLGPNNLDRPGGGQYEGPSPLAGRVNCVAWGTGNTVYVGSATGGFYKGTYGSGDWTELSDTTWPTYGVSCCAVDSTGQTIYVGTGDFHGARPNPPGPMGIMVSFEGGKKGSWSNVGGFGNVMISRIALDPDSGVVLATTGRSSPGGIDAFELGTNSSYTAKGNLWISTDSGDTWQIAAGTPSAVWSACAVSQRSHTTGLRYYYAVGWIPAAGLTPGRAQVWRSDDEGVTWHQTTRSPFTAAKQMSLDIACSPTYSDNVYVLSGGDKRISQSTDGGNNWTNITNPGAGAGNFPGDMGVGGADYDWSQSEYDYTLAVTSKASVVGPKDWVFVGLIDVASAVPNGAATQWTWQGHSYDVDAKALTHNDDHALVFDPANPNRALFGNDGGIYGMTLNGGGTAAFAPFNKSLWVSEFYNMAFLPDERVGQQSYYLGGCQDIATPYLKTGAAGKTSHWNNPNYPGDGGYCAIDPADPNKQAFSGYFDGKNTIFCYTTTNKWTGQNAVPLTVPNGERAVFIPPMLRSKATGNLYIGTNHLWQYTAGAWNNFSGAVQPIRPGSGTDYIRSIGLSADAQYLYTGSLEGSVWMDAPNGTPGGVWSRINDRGGAVGTVGLPNRTITSIAVDAFNPKKLWVTLSGPAGVARVWRCDDATAGANRTWVALPINVGGMAVDIPANCITGISGGFFFSDVLYVGTDMGVYYSTNAGKNWLDATVPKGLPVVSVRSIALQSIGGTNYLSIGTFGRGAWEIYANFLGGL